MEFKIGKRHFIKRKYGKELLIDCSLYSKSGSKLPHNQYITNFYTIIIISCGEGAILLDNYHVSFKTGTVIFIQPRQVRQWQKVSSDFDAYYLVFENEFTATFFQDSLFIYRFQFFHGVTAPPVLKCQLVFLNTLIDFCITINKELSNLQEDSHHYLRSILYNILIQLNRKYIKEYGLPGSLFKNTIGIRLKELLEAKIRDTHRVEEYANFLNISRSHLNDISKRTFGVPVSELIRERLLTEVKRDLLFTNKSIKEISYEMNYSDVSNLVRFFKKQTGINPGEYRLQHTK